MQKGPQMGSTTLDRRSLAMFALGPDLTFTRAVARLHGSRLIISLPPDIAQLVEPGRKYKVTLSAVGSITP